ncbi:aryl-sulfate sulfotransferase [Aureispira]|nr:aryl-sulfate sulfotransferase [Aureispira sp.]
MNKLIYLIFLIPTFVFSQPVTFNITINTSNVWQGNLFFKRGGTPQKPVKIVDTSGSEIFSQNWGTKGSDFKVNYNNKLSYFDRSSKGWFIMDSLQNEVDSVYCQNGYIADNHDFLALANGNYVLIAYDEQPYAMDTVVSGGDPNAIIEGLIIQELDSNHNLIFEWKSWDHFHITDNTYFSPWTSSTLPFIHANAIDIDFDGHFLLSSRALDEITKIHRTTGNIIWRWGGSQNEFVFVNDYPFTHQHSIRSLGGNRYLLYDNGNYSAQYTGTINISRAVEYVLDTNLMEATKVWEFVHPDSLYTPSIGGVQRLPNGNTLINFGNLQWANKGSIVTEVDTNNQIVFQLEYGYGANLYRAQKFDWFFYTPLSSTWDCVAGSCIDPGTGMGSYTDSLQCVVNCQTTDIINLKDPTLVRLIKITDILGRETLPIKNTPLFYFYSDGTVVKSMIVN